GIWTHSLPEREPFPSSPCCRCSPSGLGLEKLGGFWSSHWQQPRSSSRRYMRPITSCHADGRCYGGRYLSHFLDTTFRLLCQALYWHWRRPCECRSQLPLR